MLSTQRGLSDEKAARILVGLRDGKTPRLLWTTPDRLKSYCAAHPEYGREALPLMEANTKAALLRKGARLRNRTHCIHGHALSGDNLYVYKGRRGRQSRKCRICLKHNDATGRRVSEAQARKVVEALNALQRRVRSLAQERNIPPADFAKLMCKRINTRDVMVFCEKHKVSYDWLLCGDLRGLHRMTQEAKATPPEMTEAQRKEVTQLFLALSPRTQSVALGCMRELMTRGLSNG